MSWTPAALSAALKLALGITETADASGFPSMDAAEFDHDKFDVSVELDGTTAPKAELAAAGELTMTSGAYTLDLTAAPHGEGFTVDGTGKKVLAILFQNQASNNDVTITVSGSNGYNLAGDSSWRVTIKAGQTVVQYFATGNGAIGSTAKNLSIAGTGSEKINYAVVIGSDS